MIWPCTAEKYCSENHRTKSGKKTNECRNRFDANIAFSKRNFSTVSLCFSGGSMILGKNGKFKGKGYVCFIDVLGFSNDILKNWHNSESNPLEKILSIKDKMPIFDDSSEESESDSHRKYVCRVNTVSDSVTICFGYDENIMVGDMVLGLEAVIGNLSYVWSTFISEGTAVPLRTKNKA
jgi:hypothetical protein